MIEDCAHALGTTYNDKHVGLFGLAGVFSFYPTKQITTGEGGVLISNNRIFIEKIKKLKAFGIDTPPQMRKKPGVYESWDDCKENVDGFPNAKYKTFASKDAADIYVLENLDIFYQFHYIFYSILLYKTHIFENDIENVLQMVYRHI